MIPVPCILAVEVGETDLAADDVLLLDELGLDGVKLVLWVALVLVRVAGLAAALDALDLLDELAWAELDEPDELPLLEELLEDEDDPSLPKKSAVPVQVYPVPSTLPSTSGPGSGKLTSSLAVVVHPPGPSTLAMKIGGRVEKLSARATFMSRA